MRHIGNRGRARLCVWSGANRCELPTRCHLDLISDRLTGRSRCSFRRQFTRLQLISSRQQQLQKLLPAEFFQTYGAFSAEFGRSPLNTFCREHVDGVRLWNCTRTCRKWACKGRFRLRMVDIIPRTNPACSVEHLVARTLAIDAVSAAIPFQPLSRESRYAESPPRRRRRRRVHSARQADFHDLVALFIGRRRSCVFITVSPLIFPSLSSSSRLLAIAHAPTATNADGPFDCC